FQAEDGIRDLIVTGVQTCALPISGPRPKRNLLGAPTMTGRTKATLEEDLMTWLRFGLGPELERIESALDADDTIFPSLGRSIYRSEERRVGKAGRFWRRGAHYVKE